MNSVDDPFSQIAAHSGKEFFVEMKYDGEHVLLHKINKDNYKWVNSQDYLNEEEIIDFTKYQVHSSNSWNKSLAGIIK